MQLSKQQFNKLSKADKAMLMGGSKPARPRTKNNNKSKKQQNSVVSPGKLSNAPVAQGRKSTMKKAKMTTSPNGDCRIVHREYIADLVSEASNPSLFKSDSFPVNPGMSVTFPWLSQIAPRFEKYRFEKLHFDFETEAPTSVGGSVILTLDYDASDAAPVSKVQAMAYKNAVRSPPWEEACHVSAREDLGQQRQYFVRDSAVPANSDVKLYDVGNLFACSQNILTGGSATTLGELYVDYVVVLITPQLNVAAPPPPPIAVQMFGGRVDSGGTQSAANPIGDAATVNASSFGFSIDATGLLTFPVTPDSRSFLYAVEIQGTTLVGPLVLTTGGALLGASSITEIVDATSVTYVETGTIDFIGNSGSGTVQFAITSAATVTLMSLDIAGAPLNSL
jgi:hypothetical protein